jgi:DNA-binding MarR family transcriptional regulator
MKLPLTLEIVMFLRDSRAGVESGQIAQKLDVSRDAVQRALPKLVARGIVTRIKARKGVFSRYSVTPAQAEQYTLRCAHRADRHLAAMPDDTIARKLRFFEAVGRGVFGESPVLAEIIADFRDLRRRQAEAEQS